MVFKIDIIIMLAADQNQISTKCQTFVYVILGWLIHYYIQQLSKENMGLFENVTATWQMYLFLISK